jgi:hypothetical protein
MSHLSHDQQARVIACLVEGNSVRSTERLTGIHRDTILRAVAYVDGIVWACGAHGVTLMHRPDGEE